MECWYCKKIFCEKSLTHNLAPKINLWKENSEGSEGQALYVNWSGSSNNYHA